MEPEGSSQHSPAPATCPYTERTQFTPSHFLKIHFNIILPYTPLKLPQTKYVLK